MIINNAKNCNVFVSFKDPKDMSGSGPSKFGIPGYLDDQGLDITVNHDYANSLELAGSFFDMIRQAAATVQAVIPGAAGTNVKGYIQGGIMLNAPYYWRGTDPIKFNLNFYQIAETEGEIIYNYQEVIKCLSPSVNANIPNPDFFKQLPDFVGEKLDALKKVFTSSNAAVSIGAMGPCLVDVFYFPDNIQENDNQGTIITEASGGIQFLNCLCESATLAIKAPFDKKKSPIIGTYKFGLKTARIVDSSQVKDLFSNIKKPVVSES